MKTMREMNDIADVLDKMQAYENWGKGISCVKDLIMYLRKGRYSAACAVARNEWDKISSYSSISKLLINEGLFTPINFKEENENDNR